MYIKYESSAQNGLYNLKQFNNYQIRQEYCVIDGHVRYTSNYGNRVPLGSVMNVGDGQEGKLNHISLSSHIIIKWTE